MKLKKENYSKEVSGRVTTHKYTYNDSEFYLIVTNNGTGREIKVYEANKAKPDEHLSEKVFEEPMDAWNYFEELIEKYDQSQDSSGGFAGGGNPLSNINITSYIALKKATDGTYLGRMFVVLDGKQKTVFEFMLSKNALPDVIPDKVFLRDWSDEEITEMIKCKILLCKVSDVVFDEDKEADVYLFLPKSIVNQGGEEAGQGGVSGKGITIKTDKKGKGQPAANDNPVWEDENKEFIEDEPETPEEPQEPEQPEQENTEPEKSEDKEDGEEKKQGTDDKAEEKENKEEAESGEQSEEKAEPKEDDSKKEKQDNQGQGSAGAKFKVDFSDTVNKLSEITGQKASVVNNVFRTVRAGEIFLSSNNFDKIKKELQLPKDMTPKQLSEQIINAK